MGRELEVCKQVDKGVCREPYEETLESVCKSINRKIHDIQHKYKWHDLRKNPEDLPSIKKNTDILMALKSKYNGSILYSTGCYFDRFEYCVTTDSWEDCYEYNENDDEYYAEEGWYEEAKCWEDYMYLKVTPDFKVIAWREIESFVEVE